MHSKVPSLVRAVVPCLIVTFCAAGLAAAMRRSMNGAQYPFPSTLRCQTLPGAWRWRCRVGTPWRWSPSCRACRVWQCILPTCALCHSDRRVATPSTCTPQMQVLYTPSLPAAGAACTGQTVHRHNTSAGEAYISATGQQRCTAHPTLQQRKPGQLHAQRSTSDASTHCGHPVVQTQTAVAAAVTDDVWGELLPDDLGFC